LDVGRRALPEEWLRAEARQRARIPDTVRFQEKWRLALALLRQIRAAGFAVTAVLGDAEFGDNATLRRTLHRLQLPYALGMFVDADRLPRHPARHHPAEDAGT
jgi:SRSO17 transposase